MHGLFRLPICSFWNGGEVRPNLTYRGGPDGAPGHIRLAGRNHDVLPAGLVLTSPSVEDLNSSAEHHRAQARADRKQIDASGVGPDTPPINSERQLPVWRAGLSGRAGCRNRVFTPLDPHPRRETAFTIRGRDHRCRATGILPQFDIDSVDRFARVDRRPRGRQGEADEGDKSEFRCHAGFPARPCRPPFAVRQRWSPRGLAVNAACDPCASSLSRRAFRSDSTSAVPRPGSAFRPDLQTTTVAETVLRVLTNSSRIDSQAQP